MKTLLVCGWKWCKQYYHSSVPESFEVARQLVHPKMWMTQIQRNVCFWATGAALEGNKGNDYKQASQYEEKENRFKGQSGWEMYKTNLSFSQNYFTSSPEVTLWRSLNMTIKVVSSCECHLILDVILSLPAFALCLELMGKSRECVWEEDT